MYLSSVVGGVLEGSLAAVVQPLRPPLEMFAVVAPALAFSNTTNEPCCLEDACIFSLEQVNQIVDLKLSRTGTDRCVPVS